MSIRYINAVRKLSIRPTPRFVLWVLAEYADDNGDCYPSISRIMDDTGLSNRAVADAIFLLERVGVVVADRSNGRHTKYKVTPENFKSDVDQTGRDGHKKSKTSEPPSRVDGNSPVNLRQQTSEPPSMTSEPPSRILTEVHTNHQLTTNNHQRNHQDTHEVCSELSPDKPVKFDPKKILLPEHIDRAAWEAYVDMRIKKRAKPTEHACNLIIADLIEFGLLANQALNNSIKNNWTGVFAPKGQTAAPQHQNGSGMDELRRVVEAEKIAQIRDVTPAKKFYLTSEVGHA